MKRESRCELMAILLADNVDLATGSLARRVNLICEVLVLYRKPCVMLWVVWSVVHKFFRGNSSKKDSCAPALAARAAVSLDICVDFAWWSSDHTFILLRYRRP